MHFFSVASPRSTIIMMALIFSICAAPASAAPATSPHLVRTSPLPACGMAMTTSALVHMPPFARMIAAQCLRSQPRSLSARLATREKESVLHSFGVGSDGASPFFGPVASGGQLYATTYFGGTNVDKYNVTAGTVFAVTPPVYGNSGSTENAIYNFTGGTDGDHPEQLVAAGDALYGITAIGGDPNCSCGTVFKLTHAGRGWKESTIYTFIGILSGGILSGEYPAGIAVAGGVLYVTTSFGGGGLGSVIALTPPAREQTAWSVSMLYAFGLTEAYPYTIIAAGDSLYGFTSGIAGYPALWAAAGRCSNLPRVTRGRPRGRKQHSMCSGVQRERSGNH